MRAGKGLQVWVSETAGKAAQLRRSLSAMTELGVLLGGMMRCFLGQEFILDAVGAVLLTRSCRDGVRVQTATLELDWIGGSRES